jgi:hypothetical protein
MFFIPTGSEISYPQLDNSKLKMKMFYAFIIEAVWMAFKKADMPPREQPV